MSTYTDVLIHVWFNHQTFNTKEAVKDFIQECEENIESAENDLRKLAWMTEPKKFCVEDEDPEYYIENKLNYALEEFSKNVIDKYIAMKILDGWDFMHNDKGEAIGERGQDMDKMQRISGDFIKVVDKDGIPIYDESDF